MNAASRAAHPSERRSLCQGSQAPPCRPLRGMLLPTPGCPVCESSDASERGVSAAGGEPGSVCSGHGPLRVAGERGALGAVGVRVAPHGSPGASRGKCRSLGVIQEESDGLVVGTRAKGSGGVPGRPEPSSGALGGDSAVGGVVCRTTGRHADVSGASSLHTQVSRVMNNVPREAGCHVRQPTAERVRAQRPGAGGGQRARARAGRSGVRADGDASSGRSGLGDLLTPRGAGREPGGCALLRAEAVLVLQGDRSTGREDPGDRRATHRP